MILVDQTQPVECLRQPHFVCGLIKFASLLNIIHSNDRFSSSHAFIQRLYLQVCWSTLL